MSKVHREEVPDGSVAGSTIAALRRRVQLWLLFFLLLMPVGCVGPLSLFSVAPKGTETPLFIAALALPLVGLGGALLMVGDRSKSGRSLALAEYAERTGLRFVERPRPDEYTWLENTESYGSADKHMGGVNLLAGNTGDQAVWVIDYTCGVAGTGFRQTVFVLRGAALGVPNLVVNPRGWLDKLGRMLGDRGIDIPGQPELAKRFVVASADPEGAIQCLAGPAADWLTRAGDVTVLLRGQSQSSGAIVGHVHVVTPGPK
jgi:hypothetical protein